MTFALILTAGSAMAADSTDVDVTANVQGNCRFTNAGNGTLDFGTLDPTAAVDVTGVSITGVTYRCTLNASVSIDDGDGLNDGAEGLGHHMWYNDGTTDYYIPYSITGLPLSGTGVGGSTDVTLSGVTGGVLATDYQDEPAGSYVDTLTLDISP